MTMIGIHERPQDRVCRSAWPTTEVAVMTDHDDSAESEGDVELEETLAAGDEVEFMFAQTSVAATVADGRINLAGVSPMTLFFSDRPHRLTGHLPTDEFISG